MTLTTFGLTFILLTQILSSTAPVPHAAPTDPTKAPIADVLTDWISALEKDGDGKAAADLWAADDTAAQQMTEYWARLKKTHKGHDYRRWIEGFNDLKGAKAAGDATTFKVGGHSCGHLHVDWTKTAKGWRIAKVWLCR